MQMKYGSRARGAYVKQSDICSNKIARSSCIRSSVIGEYVSTPVVETRSRLRGMGPPPRPTRIVLTTLGPSRPHAIHHQGRLATSHRHPLWPIQAHPGPSFLDSPITALVASTPYLHLEATSVQLCSPSHRETAARAHPPPTKRSSHAAVGHPSLTRTDPSLSKPPRKAGGSCIIRSSSVRGAAPDSRHG